MVLPIYIYGHPVLKQKASPIDINYTDLKELIADMWETMEFANGVGLAAPQIGLSIRLFVVDTTGFYEKKNPEKAIRKVFINAQIVEEQGPLWPFEEGCLSIPELHGDVERQTHVTLKYMDEQFVEHTEIFDEMNARVIQHEYDHIEGLLFIEKIKPLKRQLIQRKLEKIRKGLISPKYPSRIAK